MLHLEEDVRGSGCSASQRLAGESETSEPVVSARRIAAAHAGPAANTYGSAMRTCPHASRTDRAGKDGLGPWYPGRRAAVSNPDGRRSRSRQRPVLEAGVWMSGETVGRAFDGVLGEGPGPRSITVDQGTDCQSRALENWAYRRGVPLYLIRPGKPVENAFSKSLNGRLRDECLTVHNSLRWPRPKTSPKPGGSTIISAARTAHSATGPKTSVLDKVRPYRLSKNPFVLVKNCFGMGPTSIPFLACDSFAYEMGLLTKQDNQDSQWRWTAKQLLHFHGRIGMFTEADINSLNRDLEAEIKLKDSTSADSPSESS